MVLIRRKLIAVCIVLILDNISYVCKRFLCVYHYVEALYIYMLIVMCNDTLRNQQ